MNISAIGGRVPACTNRKLAIKWDKAGRPEAEGPKPDIDNLQVDDSVRSEIRYAVTLQGLAGKQGELRRRMYSFVSYAYSWRH